MTTEEKPMMPYANLPIAVFMDARLSKTDLRVLGALLSWKDRNTGMMWPKREDIAKRCDLPLTRISAATTHLVELGWLKKEGNGGGSKAAYYQLTQPNLVGESYL